MGSAKLAVVFVYASLALAAIAPPPAAAAFGFSSFDMGFQEPYGDPPPTAFQIGGKPPTTQAGGRADLVVAFTMNTAPGPITDGSLKDLQLDLPSGVYGNFNAVPFCRLSYLDAHDGFCDPAAQVGLMEVDGGKGSLYLPIYNMEPAPDQAGVLGVNIFGAVVKVEVSARTDGDYGLRANIYNVNQGIAVFGIRMVLWGVPADPVNDPNRFTQYFQGTTSAEIEPRPFISLPPRCDGPLVTTVHADSWEHPGRRLPNRAPDLSDPAWVSVSDVAPPLTGCDGIDFQPDLKAHPTTNRADAPTGLKIDLTVPQSQDPEGLASANLRDLVTRLPEGLVVNPAGANGLAACDPDQIGLTSPVGSGGALFDAEPANCPDAARIGSARVKASGLADPLSGSVYLAAPYRNPFGGLLSIYIAIEGRGVILKLAGEVSADPQSGRLVISLHDAPQLAFEELELELFGGSLAPLRTPSACSEYTTTSSMTPWSAPQTGPPATSEDRFAISRPPRGGGCAASANSLPVAAAFEAGSVAPIAGAQTPFVVNLRRDDGTQRFSSLSFSPPPGLLARLAGIPACPDGALALAAARTGAEEQSTPSCSAASAVGNVYISAGAGPAPYNVSGKAYLAGPYKGAPLSLATVIPALAGPFDLGTVVVRTALRIDPRTARVEARTDPFPTILDGIPLDLRSISLRLDRPGFTRNPTSCDPAAVAAALAPVLGPTLDLSSRFQVAECGRLGFKPRLGLKLLGPTHRSSHPRLRAVLRMPGAGANVSRAAVTLPKTEFLENTHIRAVCTQPQYAAGSCPRRSVYGYARAWSPLLDKPLSGPVYLRNSSHSLPDLVASLDGQIHLDLVGKIDSVNRRIRASFGSVPDAPVGKFVLNLKGGRRGLLVNNAELCKAKPRLTASFTAHNGKRRRAEPLVGLNCGRQR